MDDRRSHWQGVYEAKAADAVSWFQPSPESSLRMIGASRLTAPGRVLDVGGGASTLVDNLLQQGFEVTVLDIADAALEVSRQRLGEAARAVDWQVADITTWKPAGRFDLWHDRAVFHFLTTQPEREAYKVALRTGLKPGGWLVMATFAEDGPEKCSGLAVQRYSAESLAAELGDGFELKRDERESHVTPWGSAQTFTWTLFRRVSDTRH